VSVSQSIQDELLVLRCRGGEPAALDELLARWQEPLWRHALRLTGDEDAAWDVLQEAFVAIARDIRRLQMEAAFGVWAYRIVGHKSHDWLRQHIRQRARETRYAAQTQLDEADEPLPATADVREALGELAEADRTLLKLRFEDGFSMDELAQMLGVPAGTVKSRLHSAKQRLRVLMEKTT
jgi:RNA polymerase sigma-70 factor, ECF subfamily